MATFVARRVLYSIPVLFVSTFLSFTFISLAGDPTANLRANPNFSVVTMERLQHTYHLDEPIPVRYGYWVKDAVTNKLGSSLRTGQPIWPDIKRTLGHTTQIILISETLAVILGVFVGIYSAIRQYSFFDYTATLASFVGLAMPVFWFALLLQILFVDIYLKWDVRIFYTSGLNSPGEGAWSIDRMQHIALPVITLMVVSFAIYSRFMRASMLDVINSDYIRTARAKGMAESRVVLGHVVRNALIPLVTVIAVTFGALLGGAIVTETVFSLDGLGYYYVSKLGQLDLYAVMGYIVVTSVIIIVFNLLADILYGFLDPRIRMS
jgi:peptide/nickel transport system permease protein